jgi:phage FluMu gp28-like protein
MQKSRQVGASWTDAYHSVRIVSFKGARLDVWVSSRDEAQAILYLDDCKFWAAVLHIAAVDLGEIVFDRKNNLSAHVLQFANGRRIYCLSSNPNAFAGKRGHVKLDEFALHPDQRLLYRVAKPVTQWGGTFSIFSTHRGVNSLFNQLIRDIVEHGNPMGWSLHSYHIEKAVQEGLVERINAKSGRNESREAFLKRLRAECIDEEQWLQEYRCIPSDVNTAFLSFELLAGCEDAAIRPMTLDQFLKYAVSNPQFEFYLGLDLARSKDLCVIDVGQKIGDIVWDRLRIELSDKPVPETKAILWQLLRLNNLKRAYFDRTGIGIQLGDEAKRDFGWKAEALDLSRTLKEQLAFALRADFEDHKLRIIRDDNLRADLRGIRKLATPTGKISFDGDSPDSHCDRFWALALRQHAARYQPTFTVTVG